MHGPKSVKLSNNLFYAFFWAIPRRLNCICRRFGTLCSIFIGRYVWRLTGYLYGKTFVSTIACWLALFSSQTFSHTVPQHFSNPVSLHTYLPMKIEQTVFRNVGIYNSDAGELPRRKHTTFRTWRKFEIKKQQFATNEDWTLSRRDVPGVTSGCRLLDWLPRMKSSVDFPGPYRLYPRQYLATGQTVFRPNYFQLSLSLSILFFLSRR